MPVVIEQLSTSFQVRDESRIRKLIQKEIELNAKNAKRTGQMKRPDPADPAAAGAPQTGGGS
ncbi:MAG TPA: hypothetical protein VN853_21050 [Polyangia bacterium]|jgi:hypothetical protein|nr:hypothetical protein [Polyangia bacterium]